MKSRPFLLLVAMLVCIAPHSFGEQGPSATIISLNDQRTATSPPIAMFGDTVIQFPDPNFEAIVRETIGKPNGDITAGDVSGVTALYVERSEIADLTGIEHFSALETLYCTSNQLTELNVSRNTSLREMDCSLNKLTTLDVSQNIALEWLKCWGNQLTSLNVRGATSLETIDCANNELTTLDVSGSPALLHLSCGDNQLTSLDVRGAAMLQSLSCAFNRLTTLDVRQNAALRKLFCGDNLFLDTSAIIGLDVNILDHFAFEQENALGAPNADALALAELPVDTVIHFPDPNFEREVRRIIGKAEEDITIYDVAGIIYLKVDRLSIADLTGIEYFTALEVLRCQRNQLTELDVSHNTRLTHLYCDWNQLKTLDLSHNLALEGLHCHNNQLSTLDLSHNAALKELDCYNNLFPDRSAIIGLDELDLEYIVLNLHFGW